MTYLEKTHGLGYKKLLRCQEWLYNINSHNFLQPLFTAKQQMYSHVQEAMSGLKSTMDDGVESWGSEALRSRVTQCTTLTDLENEIDSICDECNGNVKKSIEETRGKLKETLPKNEEEMEQYRKHIVPNLKMTMNETSGFWSNALAKIGDFFLSIFHAIKWAFSMVGELVSYLGRKVSEIFSWIL